MRIWAWRHSSARICTKRCLRSEKNAKASFTIANMSQVNIIEIKAHCADPQRIRDVLRARHAECRGVDYQIDTYFKTAHGRLKLREGRIENALVFYERENQAAPKHSQVFLYP